MIDERFLPNGEVWEATLARHRAKLAWLPEVERQRSVLRVIIVMCQITLAMTAKRRR